MANTAKTTRRTTSANIKLNGLLDKLYASKAQAKWESFEWTLLNEQFLADEKNFLKCCVRITAIAGKTTKDKPKMSLAIKMACDDNGDFVAKSSKKYTMETTLWALCDKETRNSLKDKQKINPEDVVLQEWQTDKKGNTILLAVVDTEED